MHATAQIYGAMHKCMCVCVLYHEYDFNNNNNKSMWAAETDFMGTMRPASCGLPTHAVLRVQRCAKATYL